MTKSYLEYSILEIIDREKIPMGASYLSLNINDVSQANIGRSLQKMEHEGYLEKVGNKGRVITEDGKKYLSVLKCQFASDEHIQDLYKVFSLQDKKTYIDILNARIVLEDYMVRLAVEKSTQKDINEMREILERQKRVISQGGLGEDENLAFHYKISSIADNSITEQLLKIIIQQKYAYKNFSFIQYKVSKKSNYGHFKILEAIEKRNANLASEYMYEHLHDLIDAINNME